MGDLRFKLPWALTRKTGVVGDLGVQKGSELSFVCSEALCQSGKCNQTWGFRFDAPTVGTVYWNVSVPLAPAPHSADSKVSTGRLYMGFMTVEG